MNRVLIDTDILSYFFKGDADVAKSFAKYLDHFDLIVQLLSEMMINN